MDLKTIAVLSLALLLWILTSSEGAVFERHVTTPVGVTELPTLYQYYTSNGIYSGLVPTPCGFCLNGKPIWIMSGALHYFRIHPGYWRDRLRKPRANGLLAVETYVPWNLHNPSNGVFDFGNERREMSPFVRIVDFLRLAREEDLFVIRRPGPFIGAEWEFGGMPSWLLRDPNMRVRTSYPPFLAFVKASNSLGQRLGIHSRRAYHCMSTFGYADEPRDRSYLEFLRDLVRNLGITSMLFTSDSPLRTADLGAVEEVLQTANFQNQVEEELAALRQLQPQQPLMVAEYWTGWFDHWGEVHNTRSTEFYAQRLRRILDFGASFSQYMFHGGTNFGFMNGPNVQGFNNTQYQPTITSYDYDAPLSEAGDYRPKYFVSRDLVLEYQPVMTNLPPMPREIPKRAYGTVKFAQSLSYNELIAQVPASSRDRSHKVKTMEYLNINHDSGQSYGFIIYRTIIDLRPDHHLLIKGRVRDLGTVMVNGKRLSPPILTDRDLNHTLSWRVRDARFSFVKLQNPVKNALLDIMVENLGRVNFGRPHNFLQIKGLWEGPVLLGNTVTQELFIGEEITGWELIALELEGMFVENLRWRSHVPRDLEGPLVLRGTFIVNGADTFLLTEGWGKGVAFINGFNIGRYWALGPQGTLYIPAPLLREGENTIVIFELYRASRTIELVDFHVLQM